MNRRPCTTWPGSHIRHSRNGRDKIGFGRSFGPSGIWMSTKRKKSKISYCFNVYNYSRTSFVWYKSVLTRCNEKMILVFDNGKTQSIICYIFPFPALTLFPTFFHKRKASPTVHLHLFVEIGFDTSGWVSNTIEIKILLRANCNGLYMNPFLALPWAVLFHWTGSR